MNRVTSHLTHVIIDQMHLPPSSSPCSIGYPHRPTRGITAILFYTSHVQYTPPPPTQPSLASPSPPRSPLFSSVPPTMRVADTREHTQNDQNPTRRMACAAHAIENKGGKSSSPNDENRNENGEICITREEGRDDAFRCWV